MRTIFLSGAIVWMLSALCRAESMIDAGVYADDAAAAAAWVARDGSAPVTMSDADGQRVLRFPCAFATSKGPRAYWDHATQLDLSGAEGVQFEIFCGNAGPITSFSLYFKSKGGWYSTAFSLSRTTGWETITLRRSEAKTEGEPMGWEHISALRLSAWKGGDEDTHFQLRNLRRIGVIGEDTRTAVVRNDADARDPWAGGMSKMLGRIGLRHALIAEAALKPELLAKINLVILPHNPQMPNDTAAALAEFVKHGGKLIACYAMPKALRELAGLKSLRHTLPAHEGQFSTITADAALFPDAPAKTAQASWNINAVEIVLERARVLAHWSDAAGRDTGFPAITAAEHVIYLSHVLLTDGQENKLRLLLALAGRLYPDCWREIIAAHRASMETLATFESYDAAHSALMQQTQPSTPARARLEEAARLRDEADAALRDSQFAKALDTTDLAVRKLREAFCLTQKPKAGEFRAMWCHSAFGVEGMSWDEAIQRLAENGFNAIMPNMLWGGVAYYPSKVLPTSASVQTRGDQVAACLAACRKHGLKCHVWKVNWNLGHDRQPAFLEKMRAEGRLQRSITGKEEPWLCPSHPANLALERESLLELARNYAIDGIHFDYIRYPDSDHCFCAPCRERFEKATGKPVAQWPADVYTKGVRREEWITWCQGNITALVRSTSEQVKKVRPGIQVSAAVFRDWENDSRSVMQDWKLWCEKGWLDFVCPMDYTTNNSVYENWVRRQKHYAGPADLIPGIGASASRSTLAADAVIPQIEITRKHGTRGFIIFNYGVREANALVPMLGLGATKP